MVWIFLALSAVLGIVTGFAVFSQGQFFVRTLVGNIVKGVLSIACFGMIGLGFFRFGWKVGIAEIVVIFGGSSIGVSIFNSLKNRR